MMIDDDDLRMHGEAVMEKVRALQKREFHKAIARERRRTDAEVKAAYAQAMKEKAGTS